MTKIYTIDEIRERVRPIAEKYGIDSVSLFGSYARGDADLNSDIDLLVVYRKGMGSRFLCFEEELQTALNVPVDLLTEDSIYHPAVRDRFKELISSIEKDEVRLI